ncbi:MAG: A/G-specific adenine glycosylase [Fimbriimonadales bacterium]|nr:A/G-specific adenine glycosylase [Fimbriimonadales bacterium]
MPSLALDPDWVAELRRALLAWFETHKRLTPWRDSPDPYRVWVSEVMLQQTQTATVIPYFERFIARFPTVQALAEAPLEEVLRYWEGLGYYARARNLHKAAQQIVRNGGQVPSTPDRLRELPGVGAYTAGAIASIAFGQPAPVVDGNVTRVLARLLWLKGDLKTTAAQRSLWQIAEQLIDPVRPGDFNQALMELGSTVCTPTQPRCGACPVSRLCEAYRRGQPTAVPEPRRCPPARAVADVSAIIEREGRYLLAQRAPEGLWGGLWEFPRATRIAHESLEAVAERAARQVGVHAIPQRALTLVRHTVTYSRVHLCGYLCAWQAGEAQAGTYQATAWATLDEIAQYPLSAPQRKLAVALLNASNADRSRNGLWTQLSLSFRDEAE